MGGFSIVPLAQKARTKTLIADSDLNLGNYDLIATDVKGDTAEFTEFVGGVGNFSNVLGSGNLDIEGTASIKGNTQIDGNIVLEGAINNVNIADNGEITTSQGVNGADFNGAKITSTKFNGATIDTSGNVTGVKGTFSGAVTGTTGTFSGAVTGANFNGASITSSKFNGVTIKSSGVINVTSTGTLAGYIENSGNSSVNSIEYTLLPLNGCTYTGSINFRNNNNSATSLLYTNGTSAESKTLSIPANSTATLSFTGVPYLIVVKIRGTPAPQIYYYTLS